MVGLLALVHPVLLQGQIRMLRMVGIKLINKFVSTSFVLGLIV
jgi:hypothetical protein